MKYDAKEFKRYPEIMSKEQMRIACHISKRTALYLLQFNLIPPHLHRQENPLLRHQKERCDRFYERP